MSRSAIPVTETRQRRAEKLMKHIVAEFRAVLDEQLRPHGATSAQLRLLWAIRKAPGSSGAQLARECEMTPQAAQTLIERAEEAGWILRGKDSINERIVTASLTSAGEHLLRTADSLVSDIEDKLWKGIRPGAIDELIELLEHCIRNLDTQRSRK